MPTTSKLLALGLCNLLYIVLICLTFFLERHGTYPFRVEYLVFLVPLVTEVISFSLDYYKKDKIDSSIVLRYFTTIFLIYALLYNVFPIQIAFAVFIALFLITFFILRPDSGLELFIFISADLLVAILIPIALSVKGCRPVPCIVFVGLEIFLIGLLLGILHYYSSTILAASK